MAEAPVAVNRKLKVEGWGGRGKAEMLRQYGRKRLLTTGLVFQRRGHQGFGVDWSRAAEKLDVGGC